jgi:cytochrome d ubiquinol oxidase subunit I
MTLDLAAQVLGAALAPVEQQHLDQARQMQALSFAVHIPLVCFGIAFPSMVLLAESLYVRTGDELYRTLAKRWSKVMIALFAVGVVTGTILSFELGLLWPNFMATFGGVFGLAFGLEGFSFFLEAIFIAIYVYGWDRMAPRTHLLCGVPLVIAGLTGSLFVISVNAWMNHPGGFELVDGRVSDVHPWTALFGNAHLWPELAHMYIAGFIVAGFLLAAAYAWGWLKGRRGRYERVALAIALTIAALAAPVQLFVGDWLARRVTDDQPTKLAALEGSARRRRGQTCTCSAGTTTAACATGSRSREGCRCSPGTTPTRRSRASPRYRRPIARPSTSCASRFRRWSASARCWRCSASCISRRGGGAGAS